MTTPTLDLAPSAPVNLRDLGGIRIADGVLREGLAIRTDDLATITRPVAESLVDAGLNAVIDLRSPREARLTGRGPLADYPVSYHHLPLLADVGEAPVHGTGGLDHHLMGQLYIEMFEQAAPQLVAALNIIALTPGTTAFHCAAGRDRTGVLAAALLLVLGASDEQIIADYTRTEANMGAIVERIRPVMSAMFAGLGLEFEQIGVPRDGEKSMEVSMRLLLDTLRTRHGDPLAPLRAAGLADETVARLLRRALAA